MITPIPPSDRSPRQVTILLVGASSDDEAHVQEALRGEKIRNEMYMVSSGAGALAVLRGEGEYRGAGRPDLVLLDHRLPRREGWELLRVIKGDPGLRELPVVMVDSSREAAEASREGRPGAPGYANRPVRFKQLAEIVQSIPDLWIEILTVDPELPAVLPLLAN
jgi:two-component system, chemotaxis family, response regulator Rcp1